MNEIYLICDTPGEGGYSNFKNAKQVDPQPIRIDGFATYVLFRCLDCPSYPFYSILCKKANALSYVIKIKFNDSIPDFNSLGFETTKISDGILIHASSSFFNSLDLRYKCIRVKGDNYFESKSMYKNLGILSHLGIIQDYTPLDMQNTQELTNVMHQTYGTFGSLEDAINITFKRVSFAINFFSIHPAINAYNHFKLSSDNISFGALLPALEKSPEMVFIKRLVDTPLENNSPFLTLINYLRTLFISIHRQNSSIKDIDDEVGIRNFVSQFQERNSLQVSEKENCDIKTATKIIEANQSIKSDPLPIFRMAGIDITMYTEADFPSLTLIKNDKKDDIDSKVKTEINTAITAIPDPKTKVDWMMSIIQKENERYSQICNELSSNITEIEEKINLLSEKLGSVMEESKQASSEAKAAVMSLKSVFESHQKIKGKFDKFQNNLANEQQNTRRILFLGLIFTLVAAVRLFYLQK